MGIDRNHRPDTHRFVTAIFLAMTVPLAFAFAADNTQERDLASAAVSATESVGDKNVLLVAQAGGESQESTSDTAALYSVECGQVNDAGEPFCYVDGDTYIGWRTFHGFCHVCHAQDAVGSTFAPNLLDRMRETDMTRDLFMERMNDGFTGQVGVMPPWKDNPNVSKRYNELYAYLMARASGDLPRGRPKKKPKSN